MKSGNNSYRLILIPLGFVSFSLSNDVQPLFVSSSNFPSSFACIDINFGSGNFAVNDQMSR